MEIKVSFLLFFYSDQENIFRSRCNEELLGYLRFNGELYILFFQFSK